MNLNDEVQKGNYIIKLEVLSQLRNLEEIVVKEEKMLDAIKIENLPSFKYGEEIGEKRGIKKDKLHIASNMLKAGIDVKDIALLTELNIEEVEKLKKEVKI